MRLYKIILVLIILLGSSSIYSQKVKSNTVGIDISNKPVVIIPDTEPPTINILTPEIKNDTVFHTNEEEISFIGEVTDESGIWFVSVSSDIKPVNEEGVFSTKIRLVPGMNRVEIIAIDEKRNQQREYYTIEYTPPVVTLADRISKESTYYGLIIGIEDYDDPNLPDLEYPINDAKKLYQTLTKEYNFQPDDVVLLKNPQRSELISAFEDLTNKVTTSDNLLVFYAGHGTWDIRANIGFWLPSDARRDSPANWFRNSTLVDYMKVIDTKHTLLITDACFAGSIFKTRSVITKPDKAYEKLYELSSRKAMTSGTLTEVPDRSSFTKYLIERLNENKELYLSSEELFSSFRIAVINNSDAVPQYGEIRNVGDEGGDFIFLKKIL